MSRNKAGLEKALKEIPALREEFWKKVRIPGSADEYNPELEKASRVADFMELAELMAQDALHREESCGAHFREEFQTEENEAKRDDEHFTYSANWEFVEVGKPEILHKEELVFENVTLSTRSYK
jgi:succinate dehydrogenase / fumarate reductase flavoprotein subunit